MSRFFFAGELAGGSPLTRTQANIPSYSVTTCDDCELSQYAGCRVWRPRAENNLHENTVVRTRSLAGAGPEHSQSTANESSDCIEDATDETLEIAEIAETFDIVEMCDKRSGTAKRTSPLRCRWWLRALGAPAIGAESPPPAPIDGRSCPNKASDHGWSSPCWGTACAGALPAAAASVGRPFAMPSAVGMGDGADGA